MPNHNRMGRMNRWLGAMLLLIGLAIGLGLLAWLLSERGLDWVAKFSEVASFVVACAALLLPTARGIAERLRDRPPTEEQIRKAQAYLKAVLQERWTAAEPSLESRVYEALPIQMRFAPADEDVTSGTAVADATAQGRNYGGDFAGVLATFSQEPPYRRVVLGDAGAGKTVLVTELARKLLDARQAENPLPLILPASAWNPDRQSLREWLWQQLVADYSLPMAHARALVERGRVLPILDGLDEMPSALQPNAIIKINDYRVYRPLVVTSRKDEYRDAEQKGAKVQGTVVVELQPLLIADIKNYLVRTGNDRWVKVLRTLAADDRGPSAPQGPLAQVLANPLMLWLARTVYADKSPDELADRILFNSRSSIEHYLLDELVPAVYADSSRWRDTGEFRCTAQRAQRWLGFLASFASEFRAHHKVDLHTAMDEQRADARSASELAWWQLRFAAGRLRVLRMVLRAAALFTLAWALLVWVLTQHGNWRHGAYSGPVNFGDLLLAGPVGQLIRPTMTQLAIATPRAVRHGMQVGFDSLFHTAGYSFSHPLPAIFSHLLPAIRSNPLPALFVIFYFSWAAYIWFSWKGRTRPRRLKLRPVAALGHALAGMAGCCFVFGLVVFLTFLPVHGPYYRLAALEAFLGERSAWTSVLAVSLIGLTAIPSSFTTRTDISGTVNPQDSLRLDRQADIVVTVSKRSAFAVAIWLFCGPLVAGSYAVFAGAATLVALALGGQRSFASRAYADARIWLACRGRLPWRTMPFLVGAGSRGVLRQVGAAYQFRHLRVLKQLDSSWSDYEFARAYHRWDRWRARWEAMADLVRERIGRHQDTLAGICEAVDRYRSMADTGPPTTPSGIVEAVDYLALRLKLSARKEEALAGFASIVEVYRKLAETDPVGFRPRLEKSLSELAGWLRLLGRQQDGLRVTKEAVDIYRGPAETDPAARPRFAEALSGLADSLHQLGRQEEALHVAREAVETYRKLAEADPTAFRPRLAEALGDVADRLRDAKRAEDALGPSKEAAAIYGELVVTDPSKFGRRLALALDSVASAYRTLGRKDEEVNAVRHAFAAHRRQAERIAEIRREITEKHLAALLIARHSPADGNRSMGRASPENHKDALAAARKAVAACRKLAESEPGEFLPDLSEAVRGLAYQLEGVDRRQEAQMLAEEANRILHLRGYEYWYRREESPLGPMASLALRLWKLGLQQEALTAIKIRRDLAPVSPIKVQEKSRKSAWFTRSIRRHLMHNKQMPFQERMVRFWRRTVRNEQKNLRARKDPDARQRFSNAQGNLAEALIDYGDYLDTLAFQRRAAGTEARAATLQAVEVHQEAVGIYRELSGKYPDNPAYRSDLAKSLETLAFRLRAVGQGAAAIPSHLHR